MWAPAGIAHAGKLHVEVLRTGSRFDLRSQLPSVAGSLPFLP
jgi:hypothetical protein